MGCDQSKLILGQRSLCWMYTHQLPALHPSPRSCGHDTLYPAFAVVITVLEWKKKLQRTRQMTIINENTGSGGGNSWSNWWILITKNIKNVHLIHCRLKNWFIWKVHFKKKSAASTDLNIRMIFFKPSSALGAEVGLSKQELQMPQRPAISPVYNGPHYN